MTKAMSEFTTDLQHSGMPAKDLDETIESIRRSLVLNWPDCSITAKTVAHSCVTAI
mgnify:FL=1